jgi:uncharacterized membrane protein (DUF441 family)
MDLELLKSSWQNMEKKMQQTQAFNEHIIESVIASRVSSTTDRIKSLYRSFYFVLGVEIFALTAVLAGNPFDFIYKYQFIPFALLLCGVVVALINLLGLHRSINRLSPEMRIDNYLKGILSVYDRNKKFEKWFGIILLTVGLMVPFSFLPGKLEKMSLGDALLDTAIPLAVSVIIFVVAMKAGLFRNRNKERLEKELDEWNKLKSLANSLED